MCAKCWPFCASLNVLTHWGRDKMAANFQTTGDQATSHYLGQWWLVFQHIYASLGLNELTHWRCSSLALNHQYFLLFDVLLLIFSVKFCWWHFERLYNGACWLGGHYWNYYPGALSLSQVITTYLKIRHLQMKSTGAWSSNELQWLDYMTGYQDIRGSHSRLCAPLMTHVSGFGQDSIEITKLCSTTNWYLLKRLHLAFLTPWGRVTHICVGTTYQHCFR